MPDEVRLWQIGADDRLQEIEHAVLDLEVRLQEWLPHDVVVTGLKRDRTPRQVTVQLLDDGSWPDCAEADCHYGVSSGE